MLERRAEEAAVALWFHDQYTKGTFSTESGRIFSGLSKAKNEFEIVEELFGRNDFRIARAIRLEMDYWPVFGRGNEIGQRYRVGLSLYLGSVICGEVMKLEPDGDWLYISTTKMRIVVNVPGLESMRNAMQNILPNDRLDLKHFEWAYPDTMTAGEDTPDCLIDKAFKA